MRKERYRTDYAKVDMIAVCTKVDIIVDYVKADVTADYTRTDAMIVQGTATGDLQRENYKDRIANKGSVKGELQRQKNVEDNRQKKNQIQVKIVIRLIFNK